MVALAALLACSTLVAWAASKGPDAGGYAATDEVIYSFVDISGSSGGASLLSGTDDGTAVLTLPFAVRFYGQPYTLVCASTNGALYFVSTVNECSGFDGDFANTDLTSAPVPQDRPALLPFWSDLTFQVSGAGAVLYQTLGTAPNRRFVLQWEDAFPQGSANPVTFQVILTEASSAVLFQYQSVDLGAGNPARSGAQATVGIRNAGGISTGQQLQWCYRVPVVHDRTALQFALLDAAPPAITATAAPLVLWPPNGKVTDVTIRGTIGDAGGVASARFVVTDEYGLVQPAGSIPIASDGAFSVTVSLVADRHGNDRDGRTYTILIVAADKAGNEGSTSVTVRVPHDQGR